MTITKTFTLETNEDIINSIIDELRNDCESWATTLLEKTNIGFGLDEYLDYRRKLTKEIFEDVVTKLIFDNKAE